MSQSLTVYSAPNAVSVIETMGRAIAKSQFIKCDNPEQGIVLAMTCYSKGMDFLTLAQKYDLISGRLSMKADAMLSGFRERGGKHKIIQRSGDEACVLLTYDGQEYESRMTWEDAQHEPFIYNGKESEILRLIEAGNKNVLRSKMKPKYATPRARMQMLWARVISDGVRAMCPEVNTGTYTPEEISDFDEMEEGSVSSPVNNVAAHDTPASADDAEYVAVSQEVTLASGDQIQRMTALFGLLGVPADGQLRAFRSVGGESMASVPAEGAGQLIAKMEAKLAEQSPSPPAVSESAVMADDDPATSEQIDLIKSLIESVSQREGMASLPGRIKEHLNKHDVMKITHLSSMSAQSLIDSLNGTKGIDDFFDVPPRSILPF